MRLRVRLALVMCVMAAAPAAYMGWRAMEIGEEVGAERQGQRLAQEAALRTAHLERWLESQLEAIEASAHAVSWASLSPEAQARNAERWLRANPDVVGVALVDAADRLPIAPVLQASEQVPPGQTRLVPSLPLEEARASGRAVGKPYPQPGVGALAIPVAVADAEGEAVLGVKLSLASLEGWLSQHVTPDHGIALVDQEGAYLWGADHPLVDPALLAPLLGTERAFTLPLPDGTSARVIITTLPSLGSSLLTLESTETAAPLRSQIQSQGAPLVGLAALLGLFAGALVARAMGQPLADLRVAARRVGAGQLTIQVPQSGDAEMGALGRAFTDMVLALRERRAIEEERQRALEARNQELSQSLEAQEQALASSERALQATEETLAALDRLNRQDEPDPGG